jgi:predicted phosphoribosyltransferase
LVREKSIERIVIAIPSAPGETLRELERTCEECGVPHTTMRSLEQTLVRDLNGG